MSLTQRTPTIPCAVFEGSPASKAIEALLDCSNTEAAAAMESVAKAKRGTVESEIYHGTA
jgi:hypothetical protein